MMEIGPQARQPGYVPSRGGYDANPAMPMRPGFPGPHAEPTQDSEAWELLCRLWRRKWLVLALTAVFAGLAALAAESMTERFSAEARIVIGLPDPQITDIKSVIETMAPDSDAVRTESYVIASRKMARRVAETLALDRSPIFNPALRADDPSLLERIGVANAVRTARDTVTGLFGGENAERDATGGQAAGTPSQAEQRALLWERIESRLLGRVSVEPLNRSEVISIQAETRDPQLSARIANTFADVYTERELASKKEAASEATRWLDKRLADLKGKVEASERAVEEYRRKHDLYATKSDTVIGQQLATLNDKMVEAETGVAEARSRLTQARSMVGQGGDLQSVPAVLQSELVLSLRNTMTELEGKAADLSADYTEKHPRIRNIRAQIADVEDKLNAEIERIVASLQNQLNIAENKRENVAARLQEVKSEMGSSNSSEVRLRQLEREAAANRSLYEALLQRAKETSFQPETAVPGAEVVSRAAVPLSPSFPPKTLIVAVGLLIGLGVGVLVALLVEKLDQTFRTPEDIEETTGLPALTVLPKVRIGRTGRCNHVIRNPRSVYTDALRMLGAQLSFDDRRGTVPGVTLFTSAIPGEGKSHTSCSYAQLMASEGRKVVLLDLDWRHPSQHRLFGQRFRRTGVIDLLNGDKTPEEIMHEDRHSGVHVIFAGKLSRMRGDTISFDRMQTLLSALAEHYDVVVVDTSPLRVTPEVLHLARIADRVVFAVKWGATRRHTVTMEIKNLARSGAPISGIVLTQVQPKQYNRYSYGDGAYLHHGYLEQSA